MFMILLNLMIVLRCSITQSCPLLAHKSIVCPEHDWKAVRWNHRPNVSSWNIFVKNCASYDCDVAYEISRYHESTSFGQLASGQVSVLMEISNEQIQIRNHAEESKSKDHTYEWRDFQDIKSITDQLDGIKECEDSKSYDSTLHWKAETAFWRIGIWVF